MRNRDRLKARARDFANQNGHELGRFKNINSQQSEARCIKCNMFVCIDPRSSQPLRGDALSVPCKRK